MARALASLGQPTIESHHDGRRQVNTVDHSDTRSHSATLTVNYDLAGPSLTLLSGWLGYDFREGCDCDYTPAPVFEVSLGEDYRQLSQEVRLASAPDSAWQWLAGGYLQGWQLKAREGIAVPPHSLFDQLSTAAGATEPSRLSALQGLSGSAAQRRNQQQGTVASLCASGPVSAAAVETESGWPLYPGRQTRLA